MCPAAPLEFVFMADHWLRERGRREDVDITYTYPTPQAHAMPVIAEWAVPRLEERDIDVETSFEVTEVDPDARTIATAGGEDLDYDLLVTIPPHRGQDAIVEAGLSESGWVEVDDRTLEATNAENVYALGDSAEVPTSKAGSAAHFQAGALADRLASEVRGQVPTAQYDGKTVCFIEAGLDEATFVSFEYDTEPTLREPSRPVHWAKLAYNEMYWLTARGMM
jgi:sulfide:quinone oxidoreductase